MAGTTATQRKAAVQAMFRVRASESPPGADGLRTVWHQAGDGADLTSTVDAQGRVTRQELTLFEDHLLWSAEAGIATGKIQGGKAAGEIKGSTLVTRDGSPDVETLGRMSKALADYTGTDKYLEHLRALLQRSLAGFSDFEGDQVTSAFTRKVPPAAPASAASSTPTWIVPAGIALAVILCAVAALLLLR